MARPIIGLKAPWHASDAAWLRQTIGSVEGQRLLTKLYSLRPLPTEKSDQTKRIIQSGVLEGYEALFQTLTFLTTESSVKEDKSS